MLLCFLLILKNLWRSIFLQSINTLLILLSSLGIWYIRVYKFSSLANTFTSLAICHFTVSSLHNLKSETFQQPVFSVPTKGILEKITAMNFGIENSRIVHDVVNNITHLFLFITVNPTNSLVKPKFSWYYVKTKVAPKIHVVNSLWSTENIVKKSVLELYHSIQSTISYVNLSLKDGQRGST